MLYKIYLQLPSFLQNIATSLVGYINKYKRFNREYYEHLSFLPEFKKMTYKEKEDYQLTKLQELISHAKDNSFFYREFYKNVDVRDITTLEDLKQLPILEKDIFKKNIEDIYITREIASYTGGTTGVPLKVYFSQKDFQHRMATLDFFKYETTGFKNNLMWRASFTGREMISRDRAKIKRPYRINFAAKQYLFSSFHINNSNIESYVESLNRLKPEAIDGFYSSILEIARYMNLHNIRLDYTPRGIYPTSETLTPSGVKEIEQAFGCKVYNQYASSEGAPFIIECKYGKLHIDQSTGIFEVLDNGEILVTSFSSFGTPLIRYRIGDTVSGYQKSVKCECGQESSVVQEILGRTSNYIKDGNGDKLSEVHVANFFKSISLPILKGQIVQKKNNYHVKIVLSINEITAYHYDKIQDDMEKLARVFLKTESLQVEICEDIPLENSGKYMILKRCMNE